MATTRSFSTMLNEYLPNELLKEELIKQDYVLSSVEKDDTWLGGNLIIPFKGAAASSIASGSLSADTDVAEDAYVRGYLSTQPEIWGTMIFNQRDLMEHGKVSEQNFLRILPDSVDDFMQRMRMTTSIALLKGGWLAKVTVATAANDGLLTVDRPDLFQIGQKVTLDLASNADAYVSTININTKVLYLVTARGGATPYNFAANNASVGQKVYNDGFDVSSFSSMRQALLSLANGGSTNLHNVAKTAYPYLQAINVDGASVTAANIVEKCFDAFTVTRLLGKGRPTDIVMSLTNLGYVMKVVEASKGAYNVVPGSAKAEQYGWTEIKIGSVTNQPLRFVGVQEMEDDVIMFIDWRGWKFYSNGFFRKNKSPDGNEYFVKRATTGYSYLIDICLFGDLACQRPSYNGILHSVAIVAESA